MKSSSEIEEICKKLNIRNYTINDDGSIDVNGNISLRQRGLTELPLKFNKVSGYFDCSDNKLTSLEGCPEYVGDYFKCERNLGLKSLKGCPKYIGGSFNCGKCKLVNLEYSPIKVGGYFDCSDNDLTTLKGSPDKIVSNFVCMFNELTTLEGSPKNVTSNFDCSFNILTTLKGSPSNIGGDMHCYDNDIRDLYGISDNIVGKIDLGDNPILSIIDDIVNIDFVRAFNIYKVIKDGKVQLKRLKYVMETFNMDYDIEKIKEHYEIN